MKYERLTVGIFGILCACSAVQAEIIDSVQERAYTSPIWYTP